jgi:hypothetical protein
MLGVQTRMLRTCWLRANCSIALQYACMHACMYVCVCVCMLGVQTRMLPTCWSRTCMYVCIHICICMYVCMYVRCPDTNAANLLVENKLFDCSTVCMYVCLYICTCMYACQVCRRTRICMYICIYKHTHKLTQDIYFSTHMYGQIMSFFFEPRFGPMQIVHTEMCKT